MDKLASSPKSGWEIYRSKEHRQAMYALADDYIRFISDCKTEREAVSGVVERLQQAGYAEGFGTDKAWQTLHGKAVFVARRGRRPLADGIRLISAHTDSPRLDLKQHPLIEQVGVGQAKTHYYGGLRKYQWFARPLSIHGVIVKINGESLRVRLGEKRRNLSSPLPICCLIWLTRTVRSNSPKPLMRKSSTSFSVMNPCFPTKTRKRTKRQRKP